MEKASSRRMDVLFLKESSLSRLWRHNLEHDCGIITAFRKYDNCGYKPGTKEPCDPNNPLKPVSASENRKRNQMLGLGLRNKKFATIQVQGKYEVDDITKSELAFFVVDINDLGNLKDVLIFYGRLYEQDSVLFVPKGAMNPKGDHPKACLIGTNKCCNAFPGWNKTYCFDMIHFGKAGEYTIYVNGVPFYLGEETSYRDFPHYQSFSQAVGGHVQFRKYEEEFIRRAKEKGLL